MDIVGQKKLKTFAVPKENILQMEFDENAPRSSWYFKKITGLLDSPVGSLKVHFAFPGMKVMMFEGDSKQSKGLIPENVPVDCVKAGQIGLTNMSTNGLLLPDKADEIADLHINSVTVTVNAIDPEIGSKIYSNVFYNGKLYEGKEAFEILSKNQLEGIKKLAEKGVVVKVNAVLIPGVNDKHIIDIARKVKEQGASLMNVIPLIPLHKFKDTPRPGCAELSEVRDAVEEILPVFRACARHLDSWI